MKIIDLEYVGKNGFELDAVFKGYDAEKKFNSARAKLGEYKGKIEITSDESVLRGDNAVISLNGSYKDKSAIEALKSDIDKIF